MSYIVSEVYEALREVGASEQSAKAAAGAIPVGQYLASKQDIAEVKQDIAEVRQEIAEVKVEIANEFKALYRYLWVLGGGIVGLIFTLNKLFP